MSFQNFSELKELDDAKLSEEIVNAKKFLFDMRLKKATRQTFKPHVFVHTKRKIAQLMTIEEQRKEKYKKSAQEAIATSFKSLGLSSFSGGDL